MKNYAYTLITQAVILAILSLVTPINAQIQRFYGTNLDESFSKVIKSGADYYVLGQAEQTDGQAVRATVSRLNSLGELQWTRSLTISSRWNDATLTPEGDLLVVGQSMPDDNTSRGIMGLITSGGTFTWLRSYDIPNRDAFTRIIRSPLPQNGLFPYYVLGHQTQALPSVGDVFLINMDHLGNINWKKLYNSAEDDEFANDLEVLPNGHMLICGNIGATGVIFRMDNTGAIFNAVAPELPFSFADITPVAGGGFYGVGYDFPNEINHLMKFDLDLLALWDVTLSGLVEANQVWQAPTTGDIYVTGKRTANSAPFFQAAIYQLSDEGQGASITWVKTIDNDEVNYQGGSTSLVSTNQIAYTDGRTPATGGFGQLCAFFSVSDLELNTCFTRQSTAIAFSADNLFFSPLPPAENFYDVPPSANLTSGLRTWQQGPACTQITCQAAFNFQFINACGPTVSFINSSTGPGPLSYFWDFGFTSGGTPATSVAQSPVVTFPACNTYNVCLTVTGNGCSDIICKSVQIKYLQQPVLSCPPNITVTCNADLSPTLTGMPSLTGACSGQAPNFSYSDVPSGALPCSGTVLRTWSVTDECGIPHSCVQTITVQDNVPPVAQCQPGFGITLDPDCTFTLTPGMIDAGSTDNCGTPTISINPSVLQGCGEFVVTLTATDQCNNTSTCTTSIQTIEINPPTIMCPPSVNKNCGTDLSPATTGLATATDDCSSSPTITYNDVITGVLPCNGLIQRTWTATDSCGNQSECIQNIIVIDDVAPMITCPSNTAVNTNPGQCFYNGALDEPTATDNCNPAPVITCYLVTPQGAVPVTPQTQYPKGVNTICCIADDGCVEVSQLICTYPCVQGSGDLQTGGGAGAGILANSAPEELLTNISIQTGISPASLVEDILIGGDCFDVSNITSSGQSVQLGAFTNGSTNIGYSSGVILATGPATLATGPNDSDNKGNAMGPQTPDIELSTLTTGPIFDKASLEFDFIPTHSVLTLGYVFASEEYCEKAGAALHDVFGIFISGPGFPAGGQNIALLPASSTPVGINTVNHQINTGLYINNQPAGSANLCGQLPSNGVSANELQYDGFTRKFTAAANVQIGQTYHIKIVVGDVGDGLNDSALFLDAGFFNAGGNASVEWQANSVPVSSTVYENCGMVNLVFKRVGGNVNVPLPVSFSVSGTAVPGLDYVSFNSPVVIPAGQSQFVLPVTILSDAILEGDETLIVTLTDACSFLMPDETLTIRDASILQAKCTFTVTVDDKELPTIMCPPNVQRDCDTNTMPASTGMATATDNCDPNPAIAFTDNTSGNIPCNGVITRIWTATDYCHNTTSCTQIITVIDNVAPSISCPQNTTILAPSPDCDIPVHNIDALNPMDNCGTPAVSYVVNGSTTASGAGNASGTVFHTGTSTVTYTVTDNCNNTSSCAFDVTVVCDTCTCQGFEQLAFYNFLGLPDIAVACDSTPVTLPCIGPDALYWVQWQLMCSGPNCIQHVDYSIVPAGGGPPVLSGNVSGFPFLNFSYNQLSGPGNYQLILTGYCGGDTCVCTINFALPSCCNCGGFSGLSYQANSTAPNTPVACGDTLSISCNQSFKPIVGGLFQCVGTLCPSNTTLQWILEDPTGNIIQSGPVPANPGFSLMLTPSWFNAPGVYTLTLTGQCGALPCPPCTLYFESEGCNCCEDYDAFCDLVDQGFMVIQNGCTVTVCSPQFDTCHYFGSAPNFGDGGGGLPVTVPANGCWTHTYTQNGTYTICAQVFEDTCWNKMMCTTVTINCSQTCPCGTFSDIYIRGPQGAMSQPLTCGGSAFNIGCPAPGAGYSVSGKLSAGPSIKAIMVDACAVELENEFIIVHSGVAGFNVNDLQVDFDAAANTGAPANNDINTGTGSCGWQTGNLGNFTGCPNAIAVGPGAIIPPNAYLVIQTSSSSSTSGIYDFSALCNTAQPVYVISNACARTTQAFDNGPNAGARTTSIHVNGTCSSSATYLQTLLNGTNGDLFVPPSSYYNFGCIAPAAALLASAPPVQQLDWTLNGPTGTQSSNMSIVGEYFSIYLPSSYFTLPGAYTLTIDGHSNDPDCDCALNLIVDNGCPDPCSCDLNELFNSVSQGFAQTSSNNSCQVCFTPIALGDCDVAQWVINSPFSAPVGSSTGNQAFCYTFPASGVYTVYMIVTRTRPDGTLCETFTKAQTVTVTCQVRENCTNTIIINTDFSQGAVAGPLNAGGASQGWEAIAGEPLMQEGASGSLDGWTIEVSGNADAAAMLGAAQAICLEKSAGSVSLRYAPAQAALVGSLVIDLYRGNDFGPGNWPDDIRLNLATIDLSTLEPGQWYDIEVPFDLSNWVASDLCAGEAGVLVRPAVYLTNTLSSLQGGAATYSRGQIDRFCMDGMQIVGLGSMGSIDDQIRLYPNPHTGAFVVELPYTAPVNTSYRITDLSGRLLVEQTVLAGSQQQTIEVFDWPQGLYFLQILTGDKVWGTKKFVKQ